MKKREDYQQNFDNSEGFDEKAMLNSMFDPGCDPDEDMSGQSIFGD